MENISSDIRSSKFARLIGSFSPSTRAAALLALPFALVDAVHYYTAGTAIVVSLPLLALLYLACGALAAHFSTRTEGEGSEPKRTGFRAGITLWAFSTAINTLVSMVTGALSLGVTMLLGIPYLLLCGPVHALFGGLVALLGAAIYQSIHHRML